VNPRFPIYVISKGRWESRLTVKALLARKIPHRIVIEPQEFDQYAAVIDPETILTLPFRNLGKGSIPARNWVWEHSISEGHARHWILDDNMRDFYRLHENKKWRTTDGASFRAIEDFACRYENVALAGMQYELFTPRRAKCQPVRFNTRIYSCILILNRIPYRWRGRYNEDTDLSLRALKHGWVTVLTNAFLCDKQPTLKMKGGNTDELYKGDGRLKMAQSLQEQHPDVVKIGRRWGRWQHVVDYRPFKRNKLIKKPGVAIPDGPNEYGMKLVKLGESNNPPQLPLQPGPCLPSENSAALPAPSENLSEPRAKHKGAASKPQL